ncbi:MAG: hypothetical protein AAF530_09020 [Pseudomonadota bacterium]
MAAKPFLHQSIKTERGAPSHRENIVANHTDSGVRLEASLRGNLAEANRSELSQGALDREAATPPKIGTSSTGTPKSDTSAHARPNQDSARTVRFAGPDLAACPEDDLADSWNSADMEQDDSNRSDLRRVTDLCASEELIIAAMRRWSLGWCTNDAAHWQRMHRDLVDEIGPSPARGAVAAVAAVTSILGQSTTGRETRCSRPACHPPCCPYLSPWESFFAGFLATYRDGRPMSPYLDELAPASCQGDLLLWTGRLLSSIGEKRQVLREQMH